MADEEASESGLITQNESTDCPAEPQEWDYFPEPATEPESCGPKPDVVADERTDNDDVVGPADQQPSTGDTSFITSSTSDSLGLLPDPPDGDEYI